MKAAFVCFVALVALLGCTAAQEIGKHWLPLIIADKVSELASALNLQ